METHILREVFQHSQTDTYSQAHTFEHILLHTLTLTHPHKITPPLIHTNRRPKLGRYTFLFQTQNQNNYPLSLSYLKKKSIKRGGSISYFATKKAPHWSLKKGYVFRIFFWWFRAWSFASDALFYVKGGFRNSLIILWRHYLFIVRNFLEAQYFLPKIEQAFFEKHLLAIWNSLKWNYGSIWIMIKTFNQNHSFLKKIFIRQILHFLQKSVYPFSDANNF